MPSNTSQNPLAEEVLVSTSLGKGMVSAIDPVDIPNESLTNATNAVLKIDRVKRRKGNILLAPTKPNSNAILKIAFIKFKDNVTSYTVRFTKAGLHTKGVSSWTSIGGTALTGADTDRIQTAIVLNQLVFSNNGADKLNVVDLGGGSYSTLGNSDKYRYITGFFNRVVGAALKGTSEVRVAWSADGTITQWDAAVDESAGFTDLIDSPSDYSDFIKGVYAINNKIIVIREQSLWVGLKQPVAQNPFYFKNQIPGIGTDAPYSCCVLPGQFAWVDTRSKGVFLYSVIDDSFERISTAIEDYIFDGLTDPETIYSSYSQLENELQIFIPQSSTTITKVATYNLLTKCWTIQEYNGISSCDNTILSDSSTSIGALAGTIADLSGTIANLGKSQPLAEKRLLGWSDGNVTYDDSNSVVDKAVLTGTVLSGGVVYTMTLDSKVFSTPTYDQYISSLRFDYVMHSSGTLVIYYKKDNKDWVLLKTVLNTDVEKKKSIIIRKSIKSKFFQWRIQCSNANVEITQYEIKVYTGGQSK